MTADLFVTRYRVPMTSNEPDVRLCALKLLSRHLCGIALMVPISLVLVSISFVLVPIKGNAQQPLSPFSDGQPQIISPQVVRPQSVNPQVVIPQAAEFPLASIAEALASNQSTSSQSAGGTEIGVPAELKRLLQQGGEPTSIDQLRTLENQNRTIAARAAACTVSVQIGPAQGCGVIITESGYVLTAAHVAMRPGKIAQVTLSNGRTITARTLGMNRNVDAGLMKIDPGQDGGTPWPHASLGDSKNLQQGMWCIAMGHPGGYDPTRGPVARVGRILRTRLGALETDCALIGGDSGGPLFDISGNLIAVHSRIGNDVAENLHVPIDFYGTSWDRMQQGEAYGFLPGFRPVIGVRGPSTTSVEVYPDSPAEDAGIRSGDSIEQFGEVVIKNFEGLIAAVSNTMPGERVPIWISRDGKSRRVVVEIGRDD